MIFCDLAIEDVLWYPCNKDTGRQRRFILSREDYLQKQTRLSPAQDNFCVFWFFDEPEIEKMNNLESPWGRRRERDIHAAATFVLSLHVACARQDWERERLRLKRNHSSVDRSKRERDSVRSQFLLGQTFVSLWARKNNQSNLFYDLFVVGTVWIAITSLLSSVSHRGCLKWTIEIHLS